LVGSVISFWLIQSKLVQTSGQLIEWNGDPRGALSGMHPYQAGTLRPDCPVRVYVRLKKGYSFRLSNSFAINKL
jgi:hypothetical protein